MFWPGLQPGGAQAVEGFDRCKAIADDQSRLVCFRDLLSGVPGPTSPVQVPALPSTPEMSDGWPLIRTPNPKGGPDALAIMRAANTSKSDPDLAGLIVRCQDNPALEVLLALVRPLPPRRKREVSLTLGSERPTFTAEVSPAGTALILPVEPSALSAQHDLTVEIKDADGRIAGVIPLDGLGLALAKLKASCASARP